MNNKLLDFVMEIILPGFIVVLIIALVIIVIGAIQGVLSPLRSQVTCYSLE
jgi:hypothetical protein